MKKKISIGKILIYGFFILLSLAFILPVVTMVSISLTDEDAIVESGYAIIPEKISFAAYDFVFANPEKILKSYAVTIATSVIGASLSILIMMMCAYSLARKGFMYRKSVSVFLFITMVFGGGIVSKYIIVTQLLGLKDSFLILILNLLVNVWFVFVIKSFIKEINEAIFESAVIDGASEFRIFWSIVMPLSKPAIATFGLFMLLAYWNEWMTALLYIDNPDLYPLQYLLQKVLQDLEVILANMNNMPPGARENYDVPSETVRMAMAVVATGPMLFIMPFFPKIFCPRHPAWLGKRIRKNDLTSGKKSRKLLIQGVTGGKNEKQTEQSFGSGYCLVFNAINRSSDRLCKGSRSRRNSSR